MKNIPIRHGDICFHPVTKIEGKVIKHDGSFVVGLGETTGHKHILTVSRPEDLIIRQDAKGDYYFELLSVGKLTHEEHKVIEVPAGIYHKFQEEEVDWFAQGIVRKVLD